MKTILSSLVLLAFAFLGLCAQETMSVTPQNLAGWTVVGADPQALIAGSGFALPANSQLARSFASDNIILRLTTLPLVGENSTDWPVVEFGSVALVFSRSAAVGRLVLVVEDDPPLELPFSFALDATGQSADPFTVAFRRHGSQISLDVSGRVLDLPEVSIAGGPLEIVVSAGARNPWALQRVELTLDSITGDGKSGEGKGSSQILSNKADILTRAAGRNATLARADSTGSLATRDTHSADRKLVAGEGSTSLEIFTPPAVRHGRVESVRLTAAQRKIK